jgi:CheY-like chemotaxis protein
MPYYDLSKLSILVVDDSPFMTKLLRTILRGLGVGQVEQCLDSRCALDAIREHLPDLIFMDAEMPGLDGLALVRLIRQSDDSPNPYVPVIMVSGNTKKRDVIAARDAGATEFLAKPVSGKSVYARIATCIDSPRPFVRTATYNGPDRRRHIEQAYNGPERRQIRGREIAATANRITLPEGRGPDAQGPAAQPISVGPPPAQSRQSPP